MYRLSFLFAALLTLSLSCRAGVVVIGELARESQVQPGGSFEGVVELKNTDKEPADVYIFQTDYTFRADGTSDYGEPGHAPRSNANWITVSPTRLKLGPGESLPVHYKGKVPADPKLLGTYWSMIMVEPNSAPAIAPDGKPEQVAVGLQTTIRFGVQIVTQVGKTGSRNLQVLNKSIVQDAGKRLLQLDIGNSGEQLMIPAISVELFDNKGVSAGRFQKSRTRIYPDCSVRANLDLTKVPPGKYAAMVLLDSGDAQVMGAQYAVEIRP